MARILVSEPDELAKTDIADHALTALRESNVSEVMVVARRGIAQAAYTNSEFLALGDIDGVDVIIDPGELVLDPSTETAIENGTLDSTTATKIRLAREFSTRPSTIGNKRIVLRFLLSPKELCGNSGVDRISLVRNEYTSDTNQPTVRPTDDYLDIETGIVLRAIGYTGVPVVDLPFDERRGLIPNADGRVLTEPGGEVRTGLYVTGWIKRGATGGIGQNRQCGAETAAAVLADFIAGTLTAPTRTRGDVATIVADRGALRIDRNGWTNIDAAERKAGSAIGRTRLKLVTVHDLERAAQTSDTD